MTERELTLPRLAHPHHEWERVARLESCHEWRSTYRCDCGAVLQTLGERHARDPKWPEHYDPHCRRCNQLRDGGTPRYTMELHDPS